MNNYTQDYPGIQVFKDYFDAVETQTRPAALSTSLSAVSSVNGDFKHPNPQTFTHTVYTKGSGYIDEVLLLSGKPLTRYRKGLGLRSSIPAAYIPISNFSPVAYNKALDKFYEQVRGSIDISIDLAEVGKSRKLILDCLKLIKEINVTLHKLKTLNPKVWGQLWLAYIYGIKPTMSTIYESFQRMFEVGKVYYSIKSTGAVKSTIKGDVASVMDSRVRDIYRFDISQRCRIRGVIVIDDGALDTLAGFTSLNPASIAWELTPFSFVADWFLGIGGYIRNVESSLLYASSFVEGSVTDSVLVSGYCSALGVYTENGNKTVRYNVTNYYRESRKSRTVLSSSPYPRPIQLKADLGASRLTSAASLLSTTLKVFDRPLNTRI